MDTNKINNEFSMSAFFSEKLNSNFKEYARTDNSNFLCHFEKAVVFALKRNEIKTTGLSEIDKNKINSETLFVEVNNLKNENRKLQNELEILNRKLEEVNEVTKRLGKKRQCNVL